MHTKKADKQNRIRWKW